MPKVVAVCVAAICAVSVCPSETREERPHPCKYRSLLVDGLKTRQAVHICMYACVSAGPSS